MIAPPVWIYPAVVSGLWTAWILYWYASARGTKATARVESAGSRWMHLLPLITGVLLVLYSPIVPWPAMRAHVLPWGTSAYWIGVALLAAGLAFTVWARVHLGRNWSGIVTLKEGHELIRSGPYRWVRHPIYTGLLTAFVGNAIAYNAAGSFIGVALCGVSLVRKLRIEERFMRERFGEEYSRYAASTAALVPLVY
jgi:protein-S-isoprenylcysteine O-methyltransferase Ste14